MEYDNIRKNRCEPDEMLINNKCIPKKILKDDISFDDFYDILHEKEVGNWDNVNNEETIKTYIKDMMDKGIHVSHILEALETNPSNHELYEIWLGNSMLTPKPINSKKHLLKALGINDQFLKMESEK